ncbi:hypothetical protein AQUCO_00400454v1 [Aquilegia coerulea]|uniref:Uncharacterized protein n=1 Tax=Aquilegia coerulea TaxID=218851 RepID=A0A2G5EV22_AQUCA|nr:hypothetical protein AQUCO_00400454v1 [Aquilegia coerulea]
MTISGKVARLMKERLLRRIVPDGQVQATSTPMLLHTCQQKDFLLEVSHLNLPIQNSGSFSSYLVKWTTSKFLLILSPGSQVLRRPIPPY